MNLITSIMLLCVGIVLTKIICLAPTISARSWTGHPFRFAGIAAAYSCLGAGSVGTLMGWHYGPVILLAGIALKLTVDRRNA